MAFIYNLTDTWNDVATTWNGIKLAVTDSGSSSTSKLLNLTISGSSSGYFYVDKTGNLTLSGSVNKITMTEPATGATLTLADGSSFITSGAYSTTFTTTGTTTLTLPTSGTVTALGNTTTGSGSIVLATSPTLVSPALGTPTAAVLTNATGLPLTTGVTGTLAIANGGTGQTTANAAFNALAPSQTGNNGKYLTTDGTNTSWATNPLGTVTSVDVSGGATGLTFSGGPITTSGTITMAGTLAVANGGTGITSFGTGVATALGQNVTGSGGIVLATSPTLVTPALGTPSSATLTNATGLPISTGVSGLGTGVATFLATPSSANLASAVTDETGSGPLVFATSPTFTSQVTLGTQSTTRGTLVLANTTAGSKAVTLQSSNSTAAAYTLTFPAAAPVNGYYLQTDNLGQLSWAAGGGGGGGSPGGSNTQVQFNDAATFGGAAAFTYDKTTYTLGLGVASTTTGIFSLYNASSANPVNIKSGNNSATWSLTLPTSGGSANYFLQTDGSGNTTWAAAAAGTINSGTSGQLTYYTGSQTLSGNANATISSGALTLGQAGTAAGSIILSGATSGTSTISVPAVAGTGTTFTLPSSNGTANYALTTNGSGVTSWNQISLTAGVTGTLPVANGGTGLTSGTSGGVLYYSATGTLASSAALASNALVVGGGAGVAPSTVTTGTGVVTALGVNTGSAGAFVVNGGALGTPSSGTLTNCTSIPVNQATGVLPVANGGTNSSSAGIAAFNNITGYTATGATGTTSTNLVFSTSPTLTTPTLGVASATSINKVAITAPATSATLTIADGKTATFSNSITFAGTDSTTMTFPSVSSSIGYLNIPQNSQTSAYVAAIGDVGKHISITTGGVTVNASVFSAGDVFTIYNNSSSNQTITAGTNVTFRLGGTATTGNRTLAQYGTATLLCVTGGATPTFVVSGAGVT